MTADYPPTMAGIPGVTGAVDPSGQDSPINWVGFGPLFYALPIHPTKVVGITKPAWRGSPVIGCRWSRVLGALWVHFVAFVRYAPQWAYFAVYRVFYGLGMYRYRQCLKSILGLFAPGSAHRHKNSPAGP